MANSTLNDTVVALNDTVVALNETVVALNETVAALLPRVAAPLPRVAADTETTHVVASGGGNGHGPAAVGLVFFLTLAAVQLAHLFTTEDQRAWLARERHFLSGTVALLLFYVAAAAGQAQVNSPWHWVITSAAAVCFLYQHCRTFGIRRRQFLRWSFLLVGGCACAGAAHAASVDATPLLFFSVTWTMVLAWSATIFFAQSTAGHGRASMESITIPCSFCERRDRAALFFYAPLAAVAGTALGPVGLNAVSAATDATVHLSCEMVFAATAIENSWTGLRGDLPADSDDEL